MVLLDNMTNKDMTTAVEMVDGLMLVEASGNMTLDRISSVASTGVDFISVVVNQLLYYKHCIMH